MSQSEEVKGTESSPGNFLGFLNGTNFAPMAKAIGGPNIKPLASIPALCHNCETFHGKASRKNIDNEVKAVEEQRTEKIWSRNFLQKL